ncbi:MAG: sulfatase-like hydrolase/transferase [Alphaproteobacteria bacterium]|nr:sulfatase-like hydrolase/transferase [Alphaproteobacteria bacterium]
MRRMIGAACAALMFAGAAAAQEQRPNIVLIVADDVGFTDFGAYGGEARTPHIDALAREGAQFTRYYTSPLCAPSRAMLLTGVDNHRTGLATIPEVLPPEHVGRPGYTMALEPGVETVALRLRDAGYRTYMTGKWHLGHERGDLPNAHGFERSFALDASGADNWEQRPYMPYYANAPWFEDGRPARLPRDFYSSAFIVDQMIRYLERAETEAPFFAYLAFQAVHIPVQAPAEFTAPYRDAYVSGWDALRLARHARAQTLGLIPTDAPAPRFHPRMRAWDAVTADEQALYARSMAVHAGMLDAMDHHIGRFIAYLGARGALDNTLIIVTSDNGPEPSNPLNERGFAQWMALHGYTRDLANLGERRSYVFIGPEFASATSSPGSLFKFYASGGGLHAPLVIAGPGVDAQRIAAPAFVTDVAPTILDYAGLSPQAREGAQAISGRSMRTALEGAAALIHPADHAVGIEVSGNAALFRGDYKLVRNMPPYGDGRWRLFNIAADPGETRDLAGAQPALFAEMQAAYAAYAAENGVLSLPEGYDVHRQIARNTLAKMAAHYWWALALIVLILAGLLYFVARLIGALLFRRRSVAR